MGRAETDGVAETVGVEGSAVAVGTEEGETLVPAEGLPGLPVLPQPTIAKDAVIIVANASVQAAIVFAVPVNFLPCFVKGVSGDNSSRFFMESPWTGERRSKFIFFNQYVL